MDDYQYDVFISYRRGRENSRIFVSDTFYKAFQEELSEALPHDARIFWDKEGIHAGDLWDNRLYETLACSKILVPVLIPSYLRSEWCRREFVAFHHRQETLKTKGLILPILLQNTDYPKYVSRIQRFDCEEYSYGLINPQTETIREFRKNLRKWVKRVSICITNAPAYNREWQDYENWVEKPMLELDNPSPKMTKAPKHDMTGS